MEIRRGELEHDIQGEILYQGERHQFIWLGWEEEEEEGIVQVNQYLIIHNGAGILLDPGGVEVFPRVVGNLSRYIECRQIRHIFFSHQDPDVCSGLALWMGVTPATAHLSRLWGRFVPHFGSVDAGRLALIDDHGGTIPLPGDQALQLVPAHFLHSVGNFSLWDPYARILFSADIGAAVFPPGQRYLFADDFETHRRHMEGFHQRCMNAQSAERPVCLPQMGPAGAPPAALHDRAAARRGVPRPQRGELSLLAGEPYGAVWISWTTFTAGAEPCGASSSGANRGAIPEGGSLRHPSRHWQANFSTRSPCKAWCSTPSGGSCGGSAACAPTWTAWPAPWKRSAATSTACPTTPVRSTPRWKRWPKATGPSARPSTSAWTRCGARPAPACGRRSNWASSFRPSPTTEKALNP